MTLRNIILAALCTTAMLSAEAQTRTFERNKVLVEKHTGEYCQYCPEGDTFFNGYINRHPDYEGKFVEVRHNSYGQRDSYYVADFHNLLAKTWGIDGFPRFLVDRCHPDGMQSKNPSDYGIPRGTFLGDSSDPIGRRLNKPTCVSLSLEGSAYNPATKALKVRVSGEVTKQIDDLRVNIYLTQDDGNYENLTRTYLTKDVNGDLFAVSNGRYDVSYSYTIPSSLPEGKLATNPKKMKIVAFVSTFDENDFNDSEVHNADCISLISLPSSAIDNRTKCAAPTISAKGGKFVFKSETPGAVFFYNVTANTTAELSTSANADLSKATITVTAWAASPDYIDSDSVSKTFNLTELLPDRADTNGDGKISIADLPWLISLLKI